MKLLGNRTKSKRGLKFITIPMVEAGDVIVLCDFLTGEKIKEVRISHDMEEVKVWVPCSRSIYYSIKKNKE